MIHKEPLLQDLSLSHHTAPSLHLNNECFLHSHLCTKPICTTEK